MSAKLKAFTGLFIVTLVTSFTGVSDAFSAAFAKEVGLKTLIQRTQKITQASDKADNLAPRKKIFIHQQMLHQKNAAHQGGNCGH